MAIGIGLVGGLLVGMKEVCSTCCLTFGVGIIVRYIGPLEEDEAYTDDTMFTFVT